MAKSRADKEKLLKSYKELLNEVEGFFVVDPKSVPTSTITELKQELGDSKSQFVVVKNTVFKIALQDSDTDAKAIDFTGTSAVITYKNDPTEAAKLVKKVQKATDLLPARYGVISGKFIDETKVMALADIPSREELLAKLVGTMNTPLSGFMNVATGNVSGFTRVISAMVEKDQTE